MEVIEKAKLSALVPFSDDQPKILALSNDQEGKRRLTNLIFQCYDSLKVYGKEPEQLDNLNKMFHLVLAEYPIEKIEAAMAFYLKHNTELPAPADIANIIERGNKPPFDRTVYVAISKKRPEERDSDEWEYMRDYERFAVSGT